MLRTLARVLWVCLVAAAPVSASVVVPLSVEQMTREAGLIVDARVVAVHASTDTGRIERIVSVRVLEPWKGTAGDIVHVRLAGGTVGRMRTVVPGVPHLDVGDRAVLFLTRGLDGAYRVLGLHQGLWRVSVSPIDGAPTVGPHALHAPGSGRVVRGDGSRRPRRLDAVRGQVQALLEREP